eukprot:c8401_g1_i1.p1 GENE.c8401_g1_i1~~c8401_g1_i1.p1  ORF type:complete len:361 (+),score=80.10 c8401_g1_i1:44-1126(+)
MNVRCASWTLRQLKGHTQLVQISYRQFTQSIPVIDAQEFLTTGRNAEETSQKLLAAAKKTGFFYLRHNIPAHVIDGAVGELKKFFALPLEQKMATHTGKQEGLRGYSAMYEQGNYGVDISDARASELNTGAAGMDHKEVFLMGRDLPVGHPHRFPALFAPNAFPSRQLLPDFEPRLRAYYDHVLTTSDKVFSLFATALSLPPDYFAPLTNQSMDSMNCIHYPPMPENATPEAIASQMGIGAHTDYECFTLLWQQPDGPTSLQIYLNGEWKVIPPIQGTFVVNIGDMMARWTDDLFRSTVHRARVSTSQHRYSIAFFRACNYDTVLKSLISEQGKYPPVLAGEHLMKRINEANVVKPLESK